MTRRMLIDATHPEETRVVVMDGDQLDDFDFETSTKHQLKGNIYLAKITRVEPSLQAAFVDYGGNRHGFLAFSEIHPDYFQIPQADRELLEARERSAAESHGDEVDADGDADLVTADADEEAAEAFAEQAKRRARLLRSYKIQEVIKRRQIMLVQVVKEERGTKGAALTTYLSNAGRYCVLMPNTARGGGISRKIASAGDRKRLKEIATELEVPAGMGLIIRTAGQERTRAEIRRDYEYLLRLWNDIRERTLQSIAPCLIHEEASLIKRAIRDIYTRDIEEVLVAGDDGYRTARRFMSMIMPSRARHVRPYKDDVPLLHRYGAEDQLDKLYGAQVHLRSGGSIVMNATEALTAIDVNSGRATRERHIEETAFKTNLEAADEVARQLRLRDIAGLVVIDFIDMADQRNQRAVERRLRDALKQDRARVQLGKISAFGLLELSRQRLRPSFQELSTQPCPVCAGSGVIRSTESAALQALRQIEREGLRGTVGSLVAVMPTDVALYVINQKRSMLNRLETQYDMAIRVEIDPHLIAGSFRIERVETHVPAARVDDAEAPERAAVQPAATGVEEDDALDVADDVDAPDEAHAETAEADAGKGEGEGRKRKRRRRRRRRGSGGEAQAELSAADGDEDDAEPLADAGDVAVASVTMPDPDDELPVEAAAAVPDPVEAPVAAEPGDDAKPKRRRRRRTRGEEAEPAPATEGNGHAEPIAPMLTEAVEVADPGPSDRDDAGDRPARRPDEVRHSEEAPEEASASAGGPDATVGEEGSTRRGWWSRWVRP
ncbi:Rne/Rng family ribonuclease [Marinivivus vitaminiproducens]|uniref:Rne/Rng family ribonuclease n=1 Tax=Marinivivus vitaminiproducens TaxID=3035935 RepID=UPI0027A8D70A|nr:Rne/Rng family ribonuclease [Geminicoccaceae bacterium SCSIO 64248]